MTNSVSTSAMSQQSKGQTDSSIHFLCAHHRDWLYFNAHLAMDYLEQLQQKGEYLAAHECWQEALPQLGCAWETAAILLDIYGPEKLFLVTRVGALTVQLEHCFRQLQQNDAAHQVCLQSIRLLQQNAELIPAESDAYAYVLQCVAHLRNPDHFRFYLMQDSHEGGKNRPH